MTYKHNKTGHLYTLLRRGVDCTNERNGTSVAIYAAVGKETPLFVREWKEFKTKFTQVKEPA